VAFALLAEILLALIAVYQIFREALRASVLAALIARDLLGEFQGLLAEVTDASFELDQLFIVLPLFG